MSGLKQFYMKNIQMFTLLLVIITAFLAYKAYNKYKEPSSSSSTGSAENYRRFICSGIGSMLALKAQTGEGVATNIGGELSHVDFGTYGLTSKDLALSAVDPENILERGESGVYQRGGSKQLDILGSNIYGAKDFGNY